MLRQDFDTRCSAATTRRSRTAELTRPDPEKPRVCWVDGRLEPLDRPAIRADDSAFSEGRGCYTSARVESGRARFAERYAARLARQATGAIARIKGCVNAGIYQGTAKGLAEERRAVVENFESPDVREGVDAFLEGRKPEFRG